MTSGKYKRTEEWKEKVYKNPERNKKISEGLKGSKNCMGKKNAIKNGFWYDNGYKRIGRKGIPEHHIIFCSQPENLSFIPNGFEIHHRNGIRDDNRIDNLLMLSKSDHSIATWSERREKW